MGKILWKSTWQSTPVLLPGESHGQRSLAGYINRVTKSRTWLKQLCTHILLYWASLVAKLVKNLPAMWETWVWSLGWGDPLEKGKATHCSIMAWRIPWTTVQGVAKNWRRKCQPTPLFLPGKSHGQKSLAGYSTWGCKESDMTEQLTHTTHCFIPLLFTMYY